ncbi:MAG: GumC family protein [Planctomycetaceae bacterium]
MHRHPAVESDHSIENAQALRLSEIFGYAWRYRWSAVFLSVLLVPLFAAAVFLIPAKFDSSARLLVRLGRGAVSIDPTANLSQTVSLQESRLAQVNSVKELLTSHELISRVVQQVGADRILAPYGRLETSLEAFRKAVLPDKPAAPLGALSGEEVDQQLKTEAACEKVASSVSIYAPKDAYTISLEIRTGDPFLSRDLMQAFVDQYQQYHVESHQSTGSLAFFEGETTEAKQRAQAAQEALRDAKTDRGIVDLAAAKLALGTALSTLKQNLLTTENELASTTAELASLQTQIGLLPGQIESEITRGVPRLAGSAVRQRLFDLEVAYQEAASKLTDDHPKMVSLREQLKSASEIAQAEQIDQPQTRETINPVRQQLELALKTATARLVGTQTKKESLEAQLKTLTADLAELNQHEVEVNQLAWAATLAESEYMKLAAARATARQIESLDQQQLSEISVVQPATLALKKASPRRLVLLGLTTALALMFAIGQALIRGLLAMPAPRIASAYTPSMTPAAPSQREQEWGHGEADAVPAAQSESLVGAS